jgi:Transglycosylase SLT domain
MRLTGRKRLTLTTVAATIVLVAASMTAGRGDLMDPVAEAISLDSGSDAAVDAAPVTERALHVPSIPIVQARVRDTKGTPKLPPSAFAHLDVPVTALIAYQRAAAVMEQAAASCGLSWTLLAAIGRVESDHGRYAGAQLRADGTSSPRIRGVALDGHGALARIRDTDAGQLDGDPVWDRAVGPMQFLPSTWSVVGVDADGDGARSPDDIDDAALAAAVFLCAAPGSLDTDRGRRAAVFRYNPSSSYVASVLALERAYRSGEYDTPGWSAQADPVEIILAARSDDPTTGTQLGSGPTAGTDAHHTTRAGGADPTTQSTNSPDPSSTGSPGSSPTSTPVKGSNGTPGPTDTTPGTDATGTPSPTPTPTPTPSPTPTPTPSPTPTPTPSPTPDQLTGVLTACGAGQWCLGDQPLALGDTAFLATTATSDYDADGAVESNTDELTGLTGAQVTVLATPGTAPAVVVAINGLAYG